MATGTTLGDLVEMLRVEIGESLNVAHGVDETRAWKLMLRRTQERLNTEWDWPHLRMRVDKPVPAGERYVDLPEGIDVDRLRNVFARDSGAWVSVARGIDSTLYNEYDSDYAAGPGYDFSERRDPIQRWDLLNRDGRVQIEVWPIPATDAVLRFEGLRALPPLIADDDRCALDDQLIVLHAAARIAARRGDADAALLATQATNWFTKLRENSTRAVSNQAIRIGSAGTAAEPSVRKIVVSPR